jgi:hypothetical protein
VNRLRILLVALPRYVSMATVLSSPKQILQYDGMIIDHVSGVLPAWIDERDYISFDLSAKHPYLRQA